MRKIKKYMLFGVFVSIVCISVVAFSQNNVQASPVTSKDAKQKINLDSSKKLAKSSATQGKKKFFSDAIEKEIGPFLTKSMTIGVGTRNLESELLTKLKVGWKNVSSTDGVLINPINQSKMGFIKRGMPANFRERGIEQGYVIRDQSGNNYVYGGYNATFIPLINNAYVYPSPPSKPHLESNGIGYEMRNNLQAHYLIRKNETGKNELRQILVDSKQECIFVFDLSLEDNLNFKVLFSMYNTSGAKKYFSALEVTDTDYINDDVAVKMLKNKSGFYFEVPKKGKEEKKTFSIKLKNNRNEWISDFTKFVVGGRDDFGVEGPPINLGFENWFGNDFSKSGTESFAIGDNEAILNAGEADTAYQLGAPPKLIDSGEALKVGHEVFLGDEVPYMKVSTTPEEFNVYEDHSEFSGRYVLSSIPAVGDEGKISFIYPDGTQEDKNYIADASRESSGSFSIPRHSLPKILNDDVGAVKTYYTDILAKSLTGVLPGLVSEEKNIPVHVYKFGAKPVAQIIKQNTTFTKKAEELLNKPSVLPGHTVSYVYEGNLPDTATLGYKVVYVHMTDTTIQPNKTTLIKVPVQVVAEIPAAGNLYIGAHDFKSNANVFSGVTSAQLKKKILELSEAMAWEVGTGLSDGINLTVDQTNLVPNPSPGKYTAKLKATTGNTAKEVTKDITITIIGHQNVTVTFVDEFNAVLSTPIVLKGETGKTINLKKEPAVQNVIQEIKNKQYDLVTFSEKDEAAVPVESTEKTVQYRFRKRIQKQNVTVTFVDEFNTTLSTPIVLEGEIGKTLNLKKEPAVQNVIQEIKNKQYDLDTFSEKDETAVPVESAERTVRYQFKKRSQTVTVTFVNEENVMIGKTLVFTEKIGNTINLKDNPNVKSAIKKIKEEHYEFVEVSEDDTKVKVEPEEKTVTYSFKGMLFIKSFPSKMDFGDKHLKGVRIKAEQPKFDVPFVIGDNRKNKTSWTLTATLEDSLRSEDKSDEVLPRALIYKGIDREEVYLSKGDAIPVEAGKALTSGIYNISEKWKTNKTGLKLEVFSKKVIQKGKYKSSILWQLGETP